MPCYTVREVSVEFKVGNIEILKKAIEKAGFRRVEWGQDNVRFENDRSTFNISLVDNTISSRYLNEKEIAVLSNQIKRSYSEVVISEVAQKQRWIQKKLSDRKFQLVKY